jgi:O-succinylbenzoic acid--CoA ligase
VSGGDWIGERAWRDPDRIALIAGGEVISYGALDARARDAAGRLLTLGVRPRDRVAVLGGAALEAITILHALPKLGAVFVPIHARLTPEEAAWQIADCDARALLYSGAHHTSAARAAEEIPGLSRAAFDAPLPGDPRFADLSAASFSAPIAGSDSLHTLVYTSGTTGRPKGVALTFGNHLASARGAEQRLDLHPDDRWLLCMPLYHVGGLAIPLRAVLTGCAVILHEGFDEHRVLEEVAHHRVTHVSFVPLMLRRLLDANAAARADLSSLRCVLLGGAPAPDDLLESSLARGIPLAPTYGLTECASQVATLAPKEIHKGRGTVGRALPGVSIRIVRCDGSEAPPGETGEIEVRGPVVTPGYWRRPEETRAALRDGWLATGDIGRLDPKGRLTVVDRKSDLIISGGENISPAEVERVLLAHPGVLEAAAAGRPDTRWGEVVVAAVVARSGTAIAGDDLIAHCRRHLAAYKLPRDIRIVAALPRSTLGKIQRREVVKLFE